jgi:hypothetical protein
VLSSRSRPPDQHEDEDATVKVADGIARWVLDRPLPEDKKPLAGNLVHYAFGASVGALTLGARTRCQTCVPVYTLVRALNRSIISGN